MVVPKYRSRRVEVYDERLTDRSREASELSKIRLVRMLPSEQKLRDCEFTHLDVQRAAVSTPALHAGQSDYSGQRGNIMKNKVWVDM